MNVLTRLFRDKEFQEAVLRDHLRKLLKKELSWLRAFGNEANKTPIKYEI